MTSAISSTEKAAATVQRALFANCKLTQPIETYASIFDKRVDCAPLLYCEPFGRCVCDLNLHVDVLDGN